MKKNFSKVISLSLALFLSFSPITSNGLDGLLITAEAHQGRTDASGGHHDYKNKSGLGSYHYHCGGYPAHLHTNGVCPYAGGGSTSNHNSTGSTASGTSGYNTTYNVPETASVPETQESVAAEPVVTLGWMKDDKGWWYKDSEYTYKKDGVFYIDGSYYLFDSNGYMLTGWQTIGEDEYYFDENGHMVTGLNYIDGDWYYFNSNGKLDDDYFDDYDYYDDDYEDWFE